MPGIIETELGKITIAEDIVATIVGYAAGENYGIVGMSGKTATDAILQLVGGTNLKRGVKVTSFENGSALDIDLYVTVLYGVSLPAVARNAIENVRYRVEDITGVKVNNVNIHIEAVRV
ncbi:MAG: Asp23/Gls24 family envelope stress response protein [Candidatus Gastranaerophilaceae bacterium]|jgi:uncharacterized alkaline shock family protein YloU|nr:Asp23/Gls24 family envelope stress response protein [Christensenellales bacterium]